MDADAVAVVQPPHLLFSAGCGREQRRKLFITNPSRVERLAFKVRTNAPDRVSVDVAAGVVEPRCTRAVRVFWAGDGGAAAATAAATGDVVVVSSRRLPAGTPLPEAASAALLGRDVGDAAPDAVLPVVALPRCADADGAASRLRAAATAAGPAQAAALVRALVDVLYCEGVVSAEGAVLAAGAAALALAPAGTETTTKRAARPVTPDAPPPAPATPGASPDGGGGVRALPPPMAPVAAATADDVADELLACLDRLTAVMDAARCGGPKPGAVGGGGASAATAAAEAEPVADRVKFFDSLFSYTA